MVPHSSHRKCPGWLPSHPPQCRCRADGVLRKEKQIGDTQKNALIFYLKTKKRLKGVNFIAKGIYSKILILTYLVNQVLISCKIMNRYPVFSAQIIATHVEQIQDFKNFKSCIFFIFLILYYPHASYLDGINSNDRMDPFKGRENPTGSVVLDISVWYCLLLTSGVLFLRLFTCQ